MDTKEVREKIDKIIDLLSTVDFSTMNKGIMNSNSKKVHKAYDILFDVKHILVYIDGGTNE